MNNADQPDRGIVYPVLSRRSAGLSLGINLFPRGKLCNFDCPYCEIPPLPIGRLSPGEDFTLAALEEGLRSFLEKEHPAAWGGFPLKDICFSGNGEPTLSPHFPDALELCSKIRRDYPAIAGESGLLLITNSTGFIDAASRKGLADLSERHDLTVWAKLDSGGQELASAMHRSSYSLDAILGGIKEFTLVRPAILQTMVCSLKGKEPGGEDAKALGKAIKDLLDSGCRIQGLQVYTIARPPLEPWAAGISDSGLKAYVHALSPYLEGRIPVQAFGSTGLGPLDL